MRHRALWKVSMFVLLTIPAGAFAQEWENLLGGASVVGGDLTIDILEPADGELFLIPADDYRVMVEFHLQAKQGQTDVTDQVAVRWDIRHTWISALDAIDLPDDFNGNPATRPFAIGSLDHVPPDFAGPLGICDGRITVRAVVTYKGQRNYSDEFCIKVGGEQPTREMINDVFTTDRLRAIGWRESGWQAFRGDNSPTREVNPPTEVSWGIMQVNELTWGDTADFVQLPWHWDGGMIKGMQIFNWLPSQFTTTQENWSAIKKLNLRTYGYVHGHGSMRLADYATVLGDSYVTAVRGYEAAPPW